jgi:hypothetical protein
MAFSIVNVGVVTAWNGSTHIILSPHPSGDDTAQIQAAFDMVAGKKDSIIELTAGTFTISDPIQAVDFDGTFKGAGKDATTVQTVDGFGITRLPLPPYGMVFVFYQENKGTSRCTATEVALADMTIFSVGNTQTWYHMGPMISYLAVVWITGGYEVLEGPNPTTYQVAGRTSFVSSSFTRVRIKGDMNAFLGTFDGIEIYEGGTFNVVDGDVGVPLGSNRFVGTHTITQSEFEDTWRCAVLGIGLHSSSFKFGGSPGDGNVIRNMPISALFWNVYSCNIEVSYCETFGSNMIAIFQEYWPVLQEEVGPSPSRFYVARNIIRPHPMFGVPGILIEDAPEDMGGIHTVNLMAIRNTFICEGAMAVLASHVDRAKLIRNTIEGTGPFGILVNGPSKHWLMLCNDFSEFTADVADIYMGPESTKCLAVVHDSDSVIDDGTKNKIIRLPF